MKNACVDTKYSRSAILVEAFLTVTRTLVLGKDKGHFPAFPACFEKEFHI